MFLTISAILAASFIGAVIWQTKKLPESVSATVYSLSKDKKYMWILYIWMIAYTVCPYIIDALNENLKGLGFATMASLSFCGAMPLIKNDKNILHNIFGIGAGVLSQICVALINPYWLLVWIFMLLLFIIHLIKPNKILKNNSIFISECLCAISMYGSLI